MGKLRINEEFIMSCLSNYEYRLNEIQEELIKAYKEIVIKNDLIETLQVGINMDSGGSGKKNSRKDLSNIVEAVEKKQNAYVDELYQRILYLQEKEDAVRRIWICYESLPYTEKDILTQLYIHNRKWEAAPLELQISKGTLVKRKQQALGRIMLWYESDYSNTDIMKLGCTRRRSVSKAKVSGEPEQLVSCDR